MEGLGWATRRRLLALLHVPLVILSITSVSYFLEGARVRPPVPASRPLTWSAKRTQVGDHGLRLFVLDDWLSGGPGWNALGQVGLSKEPG